jgi:hypothetical protein
MADQGYSTTITFSTGFCAEVLSVTWDGLERAAIDTTHMTSSSGWMTAIPSDLKNPGQLTVELLANPSTSPPISSSAETITVTFPIPSGGVSAASWACSGFMISYTLNDPHDDRMTATAVIKFTGLPTFTAGA